MKIVVILISLLASSTAMGQFYKCTTTKGEIAYQSIPCANINHQTRISTDKRPSNRNRNGTPWYEKPKGNTYNNTYISNTYKNDTRDISRSYDRAIERIDNRSCQRYKDWHEEAKDNWDNVRKQGYQPKQKRRHKQIIKNAERRMNSECR